MTRRNAASAPPWTSKTITVVAGATQGGATSLGAVYVFELTLDGWARTRLLVGAPRADGAVAGSGAVYVFESDGGTWTQSQKLALPNGQDWDQFGFSLDARGDWLFVGALGVGAGTVELFEFDGSSYQHAETLSAPPGVQQFGDTLSVEGDRLAVSGGGTSRVVTSFQWSPGESPVAQAQLVPGDRYFLGTGFGLGLEVSGDLILAGDPGDDDEGSGVGACYVYRDGHVQPGARLCSCSAPASAPCGNTTSEGGCATSLGTGARLRACRSASLALDDLVLSAYPVPGSFSLMVMGDQSVQVPFGDGQRCVGGNLVRLPIGTGIPTLGPGAVAQLAGLGATVQTGDTRTFQAWFRDPGGPCGQGFNLSDALEITFVP